MRHARRAGSGSRSSVWTTTTPTTMPGFSWMPAPSCRRLLRQAGADGRVQETYPGRPGRPSMEAILEDRDHRRHRRLGQSGRPRRHLDQGHAARQRRAWPTSRPSINLDQLTEIERVQHETGRFWRFYSNEHWDRRCTIKAGELVAQGAIGRVVQTTGFGPHTPRMPTRPGWFSDRTISGGIIGDIGAHQIEQFLFFTGSTTAVDRDLADWQLRPPRTTRSSRTMARSSLEGDGGVGWFRVDWYTPEQPPRAGRYPAVPARHRGLHGDAQVHRPAGRPGRAPVRREQGRRPVHRRPTCSSPWHRFLDDVRNRTETAIPQDREASYDPVETQAQVHATRLNTQAMLENAQGV